MKDERSEVNRNNALFAFISEVPCGKDERSEVNPANALYYAEDSKGKT